MEISCSPFGIVYLTRPRQGAMDLANAGFRHMCLELDMCCPPYELEHYGEEKEEVIRENDLRKVRGQEEWISVLDDITEMDRHFQPMLDTCSSQGLSFPIARAPFLMRDTKRTDLEGLLLWLHGKCIEYCSRIGVSAIVIQPLFSGISYGKEWERNREYFLKLAPVARKNHVMILLQNLCRNYNGHMVRGVCSDSQTAAEWVDRLNREADADDSADEGQEHKAPCFGFCMNVGICSLCGQDMYEFAVNLGHRLKAVVLEDCDGRQEGHMLPFTCICHGQPQTDWLSLIRGLRQIGFDGSLILDIRDTAANFSPLLRPQMLGMAKSVAGYFQWQIEIENSLKKYSSIVLFGAGNMCRNFMKCYGEKYPPLFTCDNNQNIWGTEFCGLEVKPPGQLTNLPKDCGIFICNIYYREIEAQLREMGIQNIEFFNDEYMPSFHFDRLEGV